MLELLAHRHLGVAPVLAEMGGVVAQNRCGGRGPALEGPPRESRARAHDLMDMAQCAQGRAGAAEVGGGDAARAGVPSLESLDALVRQLPGLLETERAAVAPEALDPG